MANLKVSDIERSILSLLQDGFSKTRYPYKDMAEMVGIGTEQLLEILQDWKQQGKIRRIGAIVNHFQLGLGSGAMVLWLVSEHRIEEVGQILASFDEVSHAYERHNFKNWPYNLYTMVHARSREKVTEVVNKMSQASGVSTQYCCCIRKLQRSTDHSPLD